MVRNIKFNSLVFQKKYLQNKFHFFIARLFPSDANYPIKQSQQSHFKSNLLQWNNKLTINKRHVITVENLLLCAEQIEVKITKNFVLKCIEKNIEIHWYFYKNVHNWKTMRYLESWQKLCIPYQVITKASLSINLLY